MRLSIVLLFAASVWLSAQTRGIGYIPSRGGGAGGGGGARVVRPIGGRGLYGGWGWGGYGGGGSTNITVIAPGEREPGSAAPRSALNTSSTYSPDRPKPELRVYDMLPAPGEVVQGAPSTLVKGPEQITPTVYLIAFRRGGVDSAYTYWFERDQLHFVTVHHDVKQVSVADLDRPLTELLNRKRGVEFR